MRIAVLVVTEVDEAPGHLITTLKPAFDLVGSSLARGITAGSIDLPEGMPLASVRFITKIAADDLVAGISWTSPSPAAQPEEEHRDDDVNPE
jgi:hypothetical protein